MEGKIVVWKGGSHKYIKSGITWEYEADADWFFTIDLLTITIDEFLPKNKCQSYYNDKNELCNCVCGKCSDKEIINPKE